MRRVPILEDISEDEAVPLSDQIERDRLSELASRLFLDSLLAQAEKIKDGQNSGLSKSNV